MKKDSIREWIGKADRKIKDGFASDVVKRLSEMNLARVPRDAVVPLSEIARRCGSHYVSMRLLNPIISSEKVSQEPATEVELAEYAITLNQVGATREAFDLLCQLNPEKNPQILLYQSFSLFRDWEYESSIELLKKYIELASPYEKNVGYINLLSAYVILGKVDESLQIIKKTEKSDSFKKSKRLRSNLYYFKGRVELLLNKYKKALEYFNESAELIKSSNDIYHFLVKKWIAITNAKEKNDLTQFSEIRSEAVKRGHWESIRDCDLYSAYFNNDRNLLNHVYFGSPIPGYRQHIERLFNSKLDLPKYFERSHGPYNKVFDLEEGGKIGENPVLEKGKYLHQLLKLIGTDFYRPIRSATIFTLLYENEFYDPKSSPDRIYQLIRRLRRLIEREDLGLQIQESNGAYRIYVNAGWGFRVQKDQEINSTNDYILNDIVNSFGQIPFSINEAIDIVGGSRRKVTYFLNREIDRGHIEKIGAGPKTKYKILKSA